MLYACFCGDATRNRILAHRAEQAGLQVRSIGIERFYVDAESDTEIRTAFERRFGHTFGLSIHPDLVTA